jgi:hypothetical protein
MPSRAASSIPICGGREAAAAEHDGRFIPYSMRITFHFFSFFLTISDDPHQFLVGHVLTFVVLSGVAGLESCHQSGSLVCLLTKAKIHSLGRRISADHLIDQLLDCNLMLREAFSLSVLSDGHQGFGFPDQFLVEVSTLFGTTFWVSRDALLELSVLILGQGDEYWLSGS